MLILLVCCLTMPHVVAANNSDNAVAARQVVERFCHAELIADDIKLREQLVLLSRQHKAELQKQKGPISAIVLDWGADPLYVVSSCHVVKVVTSDPSGTATVTYKRLARQYATGELLPTGGRVAGFPPKIIPDYKETDTVQLKLVRRRDRWWVLDPPLPRVAKDTLIKNYENSTMCVDRSWLAQATEYQKKMCREQEENLRILRSLSN